MANLREFLQTLVSGSEEHKWNGLAPDCVALIFVRSPKGDERPDLGQQALVCNSCPITETDAKEYGERFHEPAWRYVGHIFSYRHPQGGTQFKEHPDAEFGDEKWVQMLKAPVLGTSLTYFDKIVCRMTETSYDDFAALRRNAEVSSKEPGVYVAQPHEARRKVSRLNSTADQDSEKDFAEAMNVNLINNLQKHRCGTSGTPSIGFAPLDPPAMEMITRDASSQEVRSYVKICIEADLLKNPKPTEPDDKRLRAALLANVPFAVYCALCLTTICLIHPEEVKDSSNGVP
jgi:hypothetical protein